jgi:tricorn protease
MPSAYLNSPALGEERLFFISENSLWSVAVGGGEAKRLVSGEGVVSHPLLSPDCSLIAYAFNEEGSIEVYVMPSEGGEAERLTFHNAPSYPAGWSLDGKTLYVRSTMHSPSSRVAELHGIATTGGASTPLSIGHALWINMHSDGNQALIGKHSVDVARWKRYQGGLAGTIWIGTFDDRRFRLLLSHRSGHVLPQFSDDRVFFITDRDGIGNVYSTETEGGNIRQHTHHSNFYARYLSVRNGKLAYQCGGDIYLNDTEGGESRRVKIELGSPLKPEKSYFVNVGRYVEGLGVSNDGRRSLFTIRGKPVSIPSWSGAARQLGTRQGVRYKLPRYLNEDGDVLCVSDESGEEEVERHFSSFSKAPVVIGKSPEGYVTHLACSHDGKRVAAGTNRRKLYLLHVEERRWEQIDESRYALWGNVRWSPAWSPDDRFIAYAKMEDEKYSIFLYDTQGKRVLRATDPEFDDFDPDFDPGGKYLYFTSFRDINPYRDYLDINYSYPSMAKPYLLVLAKVTPLPFLFPHEEKQEGDKPGGEKKKPEKEEEERKIIVEVDAEGLSDRIFEFPEVKASSWCQVTGLNDKVVIASWPVKGMLDEGPWSEEGEKDEIKLEIYDLANNKIDSYLRGVSRFSFSTNREWLIYKSGGRYRVKKAGEKAGEKEASRDEKPGKQSGLLDLSRIRVKVQLREEWRQILLEAWRFQREHFWNEEMSGVDWEGVKKRYLPLLEKINTREELDDLLWEMQGELGTSHAYSMGGDFEKSRGYRVGLLGCDFSLDEDSGRYRFNRIYRGDTFYSDRHSPLSAPGVNVEEGDFLMAVNGEEVNAGVYPYAHLVNLVRTEVALLVSKTDRMEDAREVTVKTMASEFPVRYREWVKKNIRYVAEKTQGRVGYFHLPDMSTNGIVEFDRHFYQNIYKEGLIVDVRWNGGGYISQTLLQKLYRRMVGFVKSRWSNREETIPDNTFRGSLVVIADEFSGSDGDIFPQSFKNLKMGTLIGKRTWGGVVGITLNTRLVDRGLVTQPEYAIWFKEQGFRVENYGVDPDIEVDNDPASVLRGEDRQLDEAVREIQKLMEKQGYFVPEFEPIKKTRR